MPFWRCSLLVILAAAKIFSGCESVPEKGQSLSIKPITEFVVSDTQITLFWEDQSNNELGFVIERKTGSMGTYGKIATVGEDVTSYTDKKLTKGSTYYYRVSAFNRAPAG